MATFIGRFTIGQPAALSFTPADEDGVPYVIIPAAVEARDGSGTVVAIGSASVSDDDHTLGFTVSPEDLEALDTYTATFSGIVDDAGCTWDVEFEVCGGHLFDLASLRAYDASLADTDAFPGAKLKAVRFAVEQRFEEKCGIAFVPRGARATLVGDGTPTLVLPHLEVSEVYSITVDGVALTVSQLAQVRLDRCGTLTRDFASSSGWTAGALWGEENSTVWLVGSVIAVHYAHGYSTPPAPVSDAGVMYAGESLMPNVIPRRATLQTVENNSYRISIAGRDGETGIPDVDSVLASYDRYLPAVG